jgi:hypothetical protein
MLAEQIEETRRRCDESTASKISNNWITRQLYEGSVKFASKLYKPTSDTYAFSTIFNQSSYPLPFNFVDSNAMIYQIDVSHYHLGKTSKEAIISDLPQQGDPENYAIDEANKAIIFDPIPQTNAQTTNLSSSVGVADTTINVVSTSGFGGLGYIIIDNETIYYTSITSTSFTGCVRGSCNTFAATHNNNELVTWGDLALYYTRYPKPAYRYSLPTVSFTNGSATVTGVGTNWLSGQNIYPGQYIGLGVFSTKTSNENFPLNWYLISAVNSTNSLTLATPYQEPSITGTSMNAIITDMSEFYEQDCPILIAWAVYQAENIFGNKDKRENSRLAFNSEMSLAMDRRNGPDSLIVTRPTKFSMRQGMPEVRAPSNYESF